MKKILLAATLALVSISAAIAEVEKFVQLGDGNLRPLFRLKFTPPEGWEANIEGTRTFGLPVYAPKGQVFTTHPRSSTFGSPIMRTSARSRLLSTFRRSAGATR